MIVSPAEDNMIPTLTHLVRSIESVLDGQSVASVLFCVAAISGPQSQDLIHTTCLFLQSTNYVHYMNASTCMSQIP